MELIINGDSRSVTDVATVADLLVQFKLEQKILVIELNREIVERTDYDTTQLHEGDRIEIVHFVGGG
ncbi:sulfur carrier protein ThiS [Paenibacillus rigui]|uniref:Thiamine biosynthesis protein ThiS n=1 Tax=Paenibacillus rigui TaxID=554312 RepID=A0A229UKS9_9BACL|nr:sulfur carrier protein ThiS [Paenibacillus rigui]OXM84006.1 thiamine biosynthesis protein ThiS [Paenibacillus rigui]